MRHFTGIIILCILLLAGGRLQAQGLHFSQFNQAPLLLSPANCGLLPDDNYRVGTQYRNQWSSIPATYSTFSAFGDFQLLHDYDHSNWLGIGAALFTDRAGAGDLSLSSFQLDVAYHLQVGSYNMLSVGLGMAYAQRSVDFSKLTFDAQWDGFSFDRNLANQEDYAFEKTSYPDISAGINYAFFPSDQAYFRVGLSALHVNQPKESFYHSDNRIGIRPVVDIDALFQLNTSWIAEVSGYYTQQKNAHELVYGAQFSCNVTPEEHMPNILILGIYHRLDDAIIPVVGFEWNKIRFQGSIDITTSGLSPANKGNGAMEFSVVFKGLYHQQGRDMSGYSCPRF